MAELPSGLVEVVKLTDRPTLALALQNYIAHCNENGTIYKISVQGFIDYIAPKISALGASGYVAVSGLVLPTPTGNNSYSIVGKGTYTHSGGNVSATGDLNILSWDGTTWSLTKDIFITVDFSQYTRNDDFIPIKDRVSQTIDIVINDNKTYFTDGNGFINAFFDENGYLNLTNLNSIGGINGVNLKSSYDYDFVITDADGWILSYIKDGVSHFVGEAQHITNNEYLTVITDSQGYISAYQDFDGVWFYAFEKQDSVKNESGIIGNIAFTPSLGQSNSVGLGGANISPLVQQYNNIMFNGGVVPQFHPRDLSQPGEYNDATSWGNAYNSFSPLIEHTDQESILTGMTNLFVELLQSENVEDFDINNYQFLGSAPCEGGKTIAQLSEGTHIWDRLVHQMQRAYALAQESGKTINMPFFSWWHGEADADTTNDPVLYKSNFLKYYNAVNSLAKSIFGQVNDVRVCIVQLQSQNFLNPNQKPNITWAQYELAIENDNFSLIPFYFAVTVDNQHFRKEDYRHVGGLVGVFGKRLFIDGEKIKPIHPISCVVQGKVALVKMAVPVLPLVIDTTVIAESESYGFSIKDGDRKINILNVILSKDTVKFVCDENIEGFDLYYAYNGTQRVDGVTVLIVNPTIGMRGNIRDSQGDLISLNIGGVQTPLHNYMPIMPAYKLINKI